MSSKLTQASGIDLKIPGPSELGFALPGYNVPTHRRHLMKEAEDQRCAAIEADREEELVREAEAAARQARIARCDAELKRLQSQPDDIPDKAYLVAMGVNDWQTERELLIAENAKLKAQLYASRQLADFYVGGCKA